ncbi:MAG: DNA polymerase III subunit epsilon [Rhizobiaceae bacterium]|nr:DNA polymerase III subunit epsilon [Rhizobiaceae bacterium]
MSDQLREIIFDTETTGLSPKDGDRVIEIGAVELINRFPTGKTFHLFINPEGKEVHPDALQVHGISNEFLADKPSFGDVLDQYLEFFAEGNLVAHNADFDIGFLNAELARLNLPAIDPTRVVDTLKIARRKFPGQRNSLDALCSRFSVDNSHREKHGALLDSELLAEVYIELLGGRQATLTLDSHQNTATSQNESDGGVPSNANSYGERPRKLPPRISRQELEAHQALIDSIGEHALWKKMGG